MAQSHPAEGEEQTALPMSPPGVLPPDLRERSWSPPSLDDKLWLTWQWGEPGMALTFASFP